MPQLTLRHCCIADVCQDEAPKIDGNGQKKDKMVKININEEDFFDMLDHVNPKNIIKYLDMRNIPHRESVNITFRHSPNSGIRRRDKKRMQDLVSLTNNIIKMEKDIIKK